jgi:CubicO group peptidase (beta-lactamase class C family)
MHVKHLALIGLVLLALLPATSAADNPAYQPVPIAAEFNGNDGSALYVRERLGTVYGFAEQADGSYAYVLRGTRSGSVVNATFWDVAKGTRRATGQVTLTISEAGKKLTTTSTSLGPQPHVWAAATNQPVPMRGAGFQAAGTDDLDGAFSGNDGSRHYVREIPQGLGATADDVVWVGEAGAQPGVRPAWVSVFVGTRPKGSDRVDGTYVDVPKGLGTAAGTFAAELQGGLRRLRLAQNGAARTRTLEPSYTVDYHAFGSEIGDALAADGVTGFSYAIAQNGVVVEKGSGGLRITGADGGPKAFTSTTMSQAGSTTKTFTAIALIKALHDRGISLDATIGKYLPSCWARGPAVESYTFRQLLNHTSSLPRSASCPNDKTGRGDPYECLRLVVEQGQNGIVLPNTDYWKRYNNYGYALMRFLVPAVLNLKATQDTFGLFHCKNTAGVLNAKVSEMFTTYLLHDVVGPTGARVSWYPSSSDVAYVYDKSDAAKTGLAPLPDFSRRTGAGYLATSARDMVVFLGALDRGEILPRDLVDEMERDGLGFDPPAQGKAGPYSTKNGSASREGRACNAQLMLFPGGVEAYVMVNSDTSVSLINLLKQSFDDAL